MNADDYGPPPNCIQGLNYREVAWYGYTVETELDEEGNYILLFRITANDEIVHSVGLTPKQAAFLFSIPENEKGK